MATTTKLYRYDWPKDPNYQSEFYPVLDAQTVRRNLRKGDTVQLTDDQAAQLRVFISLTEVSDPASPPPIPAAPSTQTQVVGWAEAAPRISSSRPGSVLTRIRNDWTNPRAASAAGFAGATSAGSNPTNIVAAPGAGDADLGTYFSNKADYPATFNFHEVQAGWAAASGVVMAAVAGVQQVVFGRVTAKIVSGPANTPLTLQLWAITQNADGTNGRSKVIRTIDNCMVGDVKVLEGFDIGNAAAARAGLMVALSTPAGTSVPASTVELRVSKVQIVIDPDSECSTYCDGTQPRCSWDGAVDASTSSGFAPRTSLSAIEWGFSSNLQYGPTDKPLSAHAETAIVQEIGATMHRIGIDITGVWPLGDPNPNWRAPGIKWFADLMDEFAKCGLKALPLIGTAQSWMTTNNAALATWPLRTLDPAHYADWTRMWISLIDTWPSVITAVEFYNEPNYNSVWGAVPDPMLYTQHLIEMATAIKAAHPSVLFVGPALARQSTTDANGMAYDAFLTGVYAAGGGPHLDAVSVHPYTNDVSTADANAAGPTKMGFDSILAGVRRVMVTNGDTAKKIWITENGGNSDYGGQWAGDRPQALYNMLCRGIAARRGDIGGYFMHTLMNTLDQAVGQRGWGALDMTTGRRRLSHIAMLRGKLPNADWVPVPMSNGWVPYSVGHNPLAWRLNADGTVSVRGELKGGTAANAAMGVLPFKPKITSRWPVPGAGLSGATYVTVLMQLNTDGTVFAAAGGSTGLTVFDFTFTPEN